MVNTNITVATPMYGGMCAGLYTHSVVRMQKTLEAAGIGISFSFLFNESLITRARNALVRNFLRTESTHLMFIDADIYFDAAEILPMIAADKDIICGIYPKKEINWAGVDAALKRGVPLDKVKYYTGSHVVNLIGYAAEATVPINEPIEIWAGGTGFMLIKREVFEDLAQHVPTYANDVTDLGGQMGIQDSVLEFFATSIEPGTNRLLSEDYHFCRIAREHGKTVWAAPWVQLAHIGTYIFDGKLVPVEG